MGTYEEIDRAATGLEKEWEHNKTHAENWINYGRLFTPDAVCVEHNYGTFHGADAIGEWLEKTMHSFPGNEMPHFEFTWRLIDAEQGRFVGGVINRMKDPGDGSVHEVKAIQHMEYGGDGLWKLEEDVYNPNLFLKMLKEYIRKCKELGSLSPEAEEFGKNFNWI